MEINKYSFCNCVIELISDEPVDKEGNFSLFNTESSDADYSLRIIRQDFLPEKKGKIINISDRRKTYYDGQKKIYTSYFNSKELKNIDYACKTDNSMLYISYPENLRELMVFDALDVPSMLLEKGKGILHCSFIEYDGEAILFTGIKQIGKSTQAALWAKYRNAETINGDRAGIVIDNEKIYACGVPFCGTSGICKNKKLPLKAIICLSKGTENTIEHLSAINSFSALLGNFTYNLWDFAQVDSITALVTSVAEKIPVFSYCCRKDESAVDFLSNQLLNL